MKGIIKITLCFLVAFAFAANAASAQQAGGRQNDQARQVKTENEKTEPGQSATGKKDAARVNQKGETNTPAGEKNEPPEKKKWQIVVATGEKWYQLSVKLVL